MKRALVGLIAATAFVSTAVAADLPVPVEPIVAPVPVFSWTGFYVGANVGYACCGNDDVGLFDDRFTPAFQGDVTDLEPDGFFGGVQAGYNAQFDWLVAGIEADWQWSGQEDHDDGYVFVGRNGVTYTGRANNDQDWFGTLRGRAGFAWHRAFLYGTGGLAFANREITLVANDGVVRRKITADEEVDWGWVAGAGLEFAFTDNLSAKAEYQFIDIEDEERASNGPYSTDPSVNFHTFRVGVNWRFNGLFQ